MKSSLAPKTPANKTSPADQDEGGKVSVNKGKGKPVKKKTVPPSTSLSTPKVPAVELSPERQDEGDSAERKDSARKGTGEPIERKECPFAPKNGYSTRQFRDQYLSIKDITDTEAKQIPVSLEADLDLKAPLYPWQLYSLIGHGPIVAIVSDFYGRVYDDREQEWFRKAFTRISGKDHHIAVQAAYWIDAFGGGKAYHGGHYRLKFHHKHNASQVLNARGAKRWMYHMRGALEAYDFSKLDPRVKPCIIEFLRIKMQSYASEHIFLFDEKGFDF